MKLARIAALAGKEAREMLRDRLYLVLALVLPTMLMLVFGHGMSQEVENVGLAVLDEDKSAMSRDYLGHFDKTRHFKRVAELDAPRQIEAVLAGGQARAVIWIAPGFQADLNRGRAARVLFAVDGTFTAPARTLRGYLEAINAGANAELQAAHLARVLGRAHDRALPLIQPVRLQVRYLYNEEVRSIWTIAPALMMLILLLVPPLLMAVSVVREKETGSIYNLRCSTITRAEFIAGKLLPNLLVSALNAVVLWAWVVFYFGVPFRGSFLVLGSGTLLYLVGTSALGLLISLLVKSQLAALIISTMIAVIISTQFSGLFSPVESLSGENLLLARTFPASYYYEIVIGSFAKRTGFDLLWRQFAFLAGFAALLLVLCHALFRKRTRT